MAYTQIAATTSHMALMVSPRCRAMPPTANAPDQGDEEPEEFAHPEEYQESG